MLRSASVAVSSVTCKGATHPRGNRILSGGIIKRSGDIIKSIRQEKQQSHTAQILNDLKLFQEEFKDTSDSEHRVSIYWGTGKATNKPDHISYFPCTLTEITGTHFFSSPTTGYTITICPPGLECNKGKGKWKSMGVHEHGSDVPRKPCLLPEALWKPQAQRSRCEHFPSTAQRGEQALAWQG